MWSYNLSNQTVCPCQQKTAFFILLRMVLSSLYIPRYANQSFHPQMPTHGYGSN